MAIVDNTLASATASSSVEKSTVISSITYTPAEESRLVRKLDCIILPLLILPFIALQLDRGNAANAVTDSLLDDIPITLSQYNLGQQLLFLGIVILELPSNLILYRVGPSRFISAQIFAWGLVATLQAFIKGHGVTSFLFTRLLLGMCESGYIPAGLWTITCWYKREEWARRFALFFTGNIVGQASSGLLAYGVLQMRGLWELSGWQWLFIIEGCFTILVSVIFAACFPASIDIPRSLFNWCCFTARETEIIKQRKICSMEEKGDKSHNLKAVLSNYRIYPHLLINLLALAPTFALWQYAPIMLKSLGHHNLKANALVSAGGWLLLLISISLGYLADKTNQRGPVVFGALLSWFVICIVNYSMSITAISHHLVTKLICLLLAIALSNPWLAINAAWLARHASSSFDISIRMALFIMAANTSGIVGSQLIQPEDAPRHVRGWILMSAMVAGACCLAGGQILLLRSLEKPAREGRANIIVEGDKAVKSVV